MLKIILGVAAGVFLGGALLFGALILVGMNMPPPTTATSSPSKNPMLCQDALTRRQTAEKALQAPLDGKDYNWDTNQVENRKRITDAERDRDRYC